MSVNNVINKWLRRFVLHFLHPPPRMKEPPLMTPRVSPLNHVDLPVSMHSFTRRHLPFPCLSDTGAVSGAETGVAAVFPAPLLNSQTAELQTLISKVLFRKSQMV